jgi:hypothetical protein
MKVKTLLSPIHDPEARYLEALRKNLALLLSLYERLIFAASGKTAQSIRDFLQSSPRVSIVSSNGYGFGAHNAFREALKFDGPYHWIDSDRIMHWLNSHPDELKRLLDDPPDKHYTILGRTDRAKRTHPLSWTHCEAPCNRLASRRFGIEMDICVANLLLSKSAVEAILEYSSAENWGILTEWPLAVAGHLGESGIGYIAVEGNEWEDPDYFAKEIDQAGGLDRWKSQRYDSESEWLKRFQNSIDIIAPLQRYEPDRK